jgi:hypothetical protein
LKDFTSVFEMGTGGAPSVMTPYNVYKHCVRFFCKNQNNIIYCIQICSSEN